MPVSTRNDKARLFKACSAWQRNDDLLSVSFRDPDLRLVDYVQRAAKELYEDKGDAFRSYGFEARCAELVENRDRRLRDKVISLVRLEKHDLQGQMEFDFS